MTLFRREMLGTYILCV